MNYQSYNNKKDVIIVVTDGKRTVRLTGRASAIVAKRDTEDKPLDDDCVIYRYGSFCTGIEIFGKLFWNIC